MEFVQAASQIVIKDSQGNVLLDVEPFDIDVLISQAQEGLDCSQAAHLSAWVQRLSDLIFEQFDVRLTRTVTWQLVEATRMTMFDMKKKLHDTPTLPSSTESTPTN